jgi:hypothetical protein
MTAGVLRKNPNIRWTKDRGKEPERDSEKFPWFWKDGAFVGDRVNDIHLTNAEKPVARGRSGWKAPTYVSGRKAGPTTRSCP